MANLTTQKINAAGRVPSYVQAAPGGDKVSPGERTFIHVKNDSVASVTVTIDDAKTPRPIGAVAFDPDAAVVIAPDSEAFIGPLPASRFAGTDNKASVSYSATTDVTVAALGV
jgi:hypothetical protein